MRGRYTDRCTTMEALGGEGADSKYIVMKKLIMFS